MSNRQTDNSYLWDKVMLRAAHLPAGDLRVLDAFHGSGRIWRKISQLTGRDIDVIGIDKKRKTGSFCLIGDNRKFMREMNLNQFNVIDLDAYGIPIPQLDMLFERQWAGTCFVTFIQSMQGGLTAKLLTDLGCTRKMIRTCPSLLMRHGFEKFKAWLYIKGVREIAYRSRDRKHYVTFRIVGKSSADSL